MNPAIAMQVLSSASGDHPVAETPIEYRYMVAKLPAADPETAKRFAETLKRQWAFNSGGAWEDDPAQPLDSIVTANVGKYAPPALPTIAASAPVSEADKEKLAAIMKAQGLSGDVMKDLYRTGGPRVSGLVEQGPSPVAVKATEARIAEAQRALDRERAALGSMTGDYRA